MSTCEPPPMPYAPPAPARGGRLLWLWLLLALVALVLVAAGATVLLLSRRWDGRAATGDAAITVRLLGADGAKPSGDAVQQTRKILLERMRQLDLERPTVTAQGDDTLLVTAAAKDAERVKAVLVPGNLTFRLVLGQVSAPGDAGCKADPQAPTGRAAALESAKGKLGAAYDAAVALKEPAEASAAGALTGFDTLTCAEVAALPPAVQYNVPGVTCAMLDGRPAGGVEDGAQGVACDEGRIKYLMDVAEVTGADLASAKAQNDPQAGGWNVLIRFSAGGQPRWTALTREAMDKGQSSGVSAQVAVLMDNQVVTAPAIQAVIPGDAQVSGGDLSSRDGASALAATLSHGVLPLRLVITGVGSTP
ncbi:SecDF P1 head subdomain-containing protein [Dactylosporangium sp. CA-139066]|uniref:SecDF P1 head subdomain-containing protein n=1 Tax=Dactylosporangium sp. CA-139066 TaxID=3239930 RepID=UPI003D940BFE